MDNTSFLTELRSLTAPERGKGICTCLFSWLNRGYAPEKLEESLADPVRDACERLLRGETHLSDVLVIARRILEGREYLRAKYPQLSGETPVLLLSWPGEMLCHPSHSVTVYLARALGYGVEDLPLGVDPAEVRMTRSGALGLISRTLDRPRGQDLTVAVPGNPAESLPCDLDLLLRVAGSLSCVSGCFQQIGNPPFEDRKGCGPGL